MILAAGMGSRYGGLKQLDPIGPGGQTLMDYSIYDALRAGFDKLVFVIRHGFAETFQAQVGGRYHGHAAVDYAFQELDTATAGYATPAERQKPWGTGHAILAAAGAIREPFAVINADDYYGPHSFATLAACLASPQTCHPGRYAMVGYRLRNTLSENGTVARGICGVDPQGKLLKVTEHTRIAARGAAVDALDEAGRTVELTGEEIVSMNFWGFHPAIFGQLQAQFLEFLEQRGQDVKAEFYIPSAVDRLIHEGTVETYVLPTEDTWFGVTYREDRDGVVAAVRGLVERGVYPAELF